MSQRAAPRPVASTGRGMPRWSKGGHKVGSPASMAGLFGSNARLGVMPPLRFSPRRRARALAMSPCAVKLQTAPLSRL